MSQWLAGQCQGWDIVPSTCHVLGCTVVLSQADVFSFGIIMYEVLQRYIVLSAVAVAGTYEELESYCGRVAGGYRPPLHSKWPASVAKLIQVGREQDKLLDVCTL